MGDTMNRVPSVFALLFLAIVILGSACRENEMSHPDSNPQASPASLEKLQIYLARGNALDGFDYFILTDGTQASVARRTLAGHRYYEFAIDSQAVRDLYSAATAGELLGRKEVISSDIVDGTQWVLGIELEEQQTAVYLNNRFPEPFLAFAGTIDSITASSAGAGNKKNLPSDFKSSVDARMEQIIRDAASADKGTVRK